MLIAKINLIFVLTLMLAGSVFSQTDREKGLKLFAEGKNKEAINALEKAGKQAKNDAEIWNALGLAYTKDTNTKKAVKSFERAVEFSPQNAVYQTNLAYAYLLTGKYNKAEKAASEAIKLNAKNAVAYYLRGSANVRAGKIEQAIADAEQSIKLDTNYALAYLLKSDALLLNFGTRVGNGSLPIAEIGLLAQAKEILETCLKSCQNNLQAPLQQTRLETLTVFYNYFSKNRATVLNQAGGAEQDQTAAPVSSDPNITPLKILSKKPANYTDEARQNNIEGTIRLAVFFSDTGKVTHTLVLKGLGGGLIENAVKAASSIKFEPAKKDGKPISQIKIVEYSFDIY